MDNKTIQKLNAFLGQLTDLQQGFLEEIVIKKGEDAELLADILKGEIKKQQESIAEDKKQKIELDEDIELTKEMEENLSEEDAKWYCMECGHIRRGDERVAAGMKCMHCSYGW